VRVDPKQSETAEAVEVVAEDVALPETEADPERVADFQRFGPASEDVALLNQQAPRFMKRFMDGKATPDEVWRQFTMRNRKCFGCGSPKCAILIRVFMPLKEAYERNPDLMVQMAMFAAANGVQSMPTVQFGNPPEDFIRVSEKAACDACKHTAEIAAARGPSWAVVEIKRGPGSLNPVVQAARLRPQG